jgi:polysaccharide transporter, PST family
MSRLPLMRRLFNSPVIRNSVTLYGMQFLDLVLPLITVPYVVRVIHPEGFGITSFVLSFSAYFALLVEYGFSLTSTRDVSLHQENPAELNRVFSETLVAKGALFVASFLAMLLLVAGLPQLRDVWPMVLAAYLSLAGNVLIPVWLFQGLEKMSFLFVSNLITKIVMVGLIFTLVKGPNDALAYIFILSGCQVLNGLMSLGYARFVFNVRFVSVRVRTVAQMLSANFPYFINNVSGSIYVTGNAFLLGLFATPAQVGIYSGAEKIMRAAVGLLSPMSQAFFPRSVKYLQKSAGERSAYYRMLVGLFLAVGIIGSILLYTLAPLSVRLILGPSFNGAVPLLRLMSPIPVFVSLAMAYGTQMMVPLGKISVFLWFTIGAGIADFLLIIAAAPRLGGMAAAGAVLVAEISMGLCSFFYIQRRNRVVLEE